MKPDQKLRRIVITVFGTLTCVGSLVVAHPLHAQALLLEESDASAGATKAIPHVEALLTPAPTDPSGQAILSVTISVSPGSYTYSMNPDFGGATRIDVSDANGLTPVNPEFQADRPPKRVFEPIFGQELEKFYDRVMWSQVYQRDPSVDSAQISIQGKISYQVCDENSCRPFSETFQLTLSTEQADKGTSAPSAGTTSASDDSIGASGLETQMPAPRAHGDQVPPEPSVVSPVHSMRRIDFDHLQIERSALGDTHLAIVLLMAFAAGFILNFMPCVLPVIGLKIMAFVQQAGDSRGRILLLNVWFALGLISVFLILATLAVFLGLGWGEQFSSATFNVILTSVVFAFALSFLGVWEIPIPGFSGSGKAVALTEKEGVAGAFAKGVLTTVLATPCSGPMLGPALTWAVSQPPQITYAAFVSVGLGMASPYLLIGLFPRLLAFLPKPGAWMDTFKQIMGFVLLGTVVFLLTFLSIPYVVPCFAFMIGLWAACWWIGRTSLTEPLGTKLRAWGQAVAFAAVIGLVSFGWLRHVMQSRFDQAIQKEVATQNVNAGAPTADTDWSRGEIPWQPFSRNRLDQLVASGKTVFVDFTADW